MASQVYSIRILAGHDGATSTFVVPVGYVVIVRDIQVFNAGLFLPTTFSLVETPSDITLWQDLVSTEALAQFVGRIVCEAGSTLTASATEAGDYVVSGYLLSLP
jgi:hypothetical protein